jgi:hypothetical protein
MMRACFFRTPGILTLPPAIPGTFRRRPTANASISSHLRLLPPLGKGEVVGSIPTGSTIKSNTYEIGMGYLCSKMNTGSVRGAVCRGEINGPATGWIGHFLAEGCRRSEIISRRHFFVRSR